MVKYYKFCVEERTKGTDPVNWDVAYQIPSPVVLKPAVDITFIRQFC